MSNNISTATVNKPSAPPVQNRKPVRIPLLLRLFRLGFHIGGIISPRLSGYIAYRLWITPPRFKVPESELEALASATIEQLAVNNHNITTYLWGSAAPTVLLVHGWSGRGTQLGSFVEPLIESGYRVLSFDAPAHGKSSGKQTNIFEIADAIRVLDNKYGPFESAITHSFGGPCLAIAMQKGTSISSVVNISPPAETSGLVKKFASALQITARVEKELMLSIEKRYGANIWQETSMENNVRDLDIPALVIHDVDDIDVPWHEGQAIAQAWSKVRFIKTSKLGHRRILRDPATIKTSVEFIQANSPPQ